MRVTINSKRAAFSTNILLLPEQWDAMKQQVRGNSPLARELNSLMHTFTTLAWNAYNENLRHNSVNTPEAIRDIVLNKNRSKTSYLDAFEYQIDNLKSRVGFDIAINTVKKYETARRKLIVFLKAVYGRDDILLSELTPKIISELDLFMRTKEKLKHNAVIKNMQQFNRVIRISMDNDWIDKDPFAKYSFKTDDTERGYLSAKELSLMEQINLPSKRLEHVRDVFVFCCYTGLAYVDVSKLSPSHIETDANGIGWIRINRTKSKTRASIPILPKAQEILNKYADLRPVGGYKHLLPVISNQNLNKYVKEIAELCGIKKRVSMHLARHTFATTVTLEQGVDISTVSKMLGHKNIRTTQIYAKVTELKIAQDMKKLMKPRD